jgi:hypothetical protein
VGRQSALGVRVGWGSGIELDSIQKSREERRKTRGERRKGGGLFWSRSKTQGGKHKENS